MSNDAIAAYVDNPNNDTSASSSLDAKNLNKIHLNFQFLGKGGEYFRIWIVNILLTILTLGIYSAWAKVRNNRYFYGNTLLNDHSFEYLASPITILKGRLIAVAILIVYILMDQFFPLLSIALYIALILFMPWLICRAMAFRAANTRYRNIRFGFDGRYAEALKAFILWPILGVLTLGLLFPYAVYKQKYFLVKNSRYGTRSFEPNFNWKQFFNIYLVAFGIVAVGILMLFVVPIVGGFITGITYFMAFAYVSANTTNVIYNSTALDRHGFECRLDFLKLAFIYFTNGLVIILSLGLMIPWTKVRLALYQAECLDLLAEGSLEAFIAAEDQRCNAFGEEMGEAFDLDIGL